MYDLNGKTALVTGAGGRHGIGRAIATRLASEGADVVVTDVEASLDAIRTEDRLDGWEGLPSVVKEIQDLGRRSLGLYYDVADSAQVDAMVSDTLGEFGKIDILVNNAGSRPGPGPCADCGSRGRCVRRRDARQRPGNLPGQPAP